MISKKDKIFIGLTDIANIPMMFKKAFQENGYFCDYYTWSNDEDHPFGYEKDKILSLFKNPPPFRLFGKNPFYVVNIFFRIYYFIRILFTYKVFFFISPKSFLKNNIDLPVIKFFNKKIYFIFTGCIERDPEFPQADEDYICKRCMDIPLQKYCFCNNLSEKINRVQRLEKYSDFIIGQDDITSYIKNKSKLIWLYLITAYPKNKINILKKYNQKELRIIHFPSNPLVKQSHIIIPILRRFENIENVKVIIKEGIWSREKIEKELSEAHILINALGTGYNTLPIEAMSYGCVVVNSHPDWFKKNVPDAPIYETYAKSLFEDINYLIQKREVLMNYAFSGLEYYYKYHCPKAAGNFYCNYL